MFNKKLFKGHHQEMTKASKSGFSLVEILVALTLLGLAGTFVAGKIFQSLYEGQVQSTRIQMQGLKARLKEYRRKCHSYPTSDQGLEALVTKPSGGRECRNYPPEGFIDGDEAPRDPWDNDFIYESNGKTFNITSLGPDGEEGGEGNDVDISLNAKKE